jgi:hypothetical protein
MGAQPDVEAELAEALDEPEADPAAVEAIEA